MKILYSNEEYVSELLKIYNNYVSYYAFGAFGAPATEKNKIRYKVPEAPDVSFLFDCSGFAYRALPWGWCGDRRRVYGGADYPKEGDDLYPLVTGDICSICTYVSSDFDEILPGEVLYMRGHVGIYIGDGKAIECTSKWDNCVQITQVKNVKKSPVMKKSRTWLRHGRLPFIDYGIEALFEPAYTIAKIGEGLIRISRRTGVSLEELKRLNPSIKGPAYLVRIGQKVRIR